MCRGFHLSPSWENEGHKWPLGSVDRHNNTIASNKALDFAQHVPPANPLWGQVRPGRGSLVRVYLWENGGQRTEVGRQPS